MNNQTGIKYDPDWIENPSGAYQDWDYVTFHMGYDEGYKAALEKYTLSEKHS